ncbi:hypothetical protein EGI20_17120 [Aquitalea sp. S1-19]|nr:hypothetical protein [Aquitalea sp. S1-19]MCP9760858.1 hypothetical protein [Aquitalea sp. S1-19]MCP9760976.1 hypothetical protein [Aquitalea sp. S1-19]
MSSRILLSAGFTALLLGCTTAPPAHEELEPVPPRPNLALMGPGPVLGFSAPQYCPGAPLRMIYYPFTDAERVKLQAHADCLKHHPKVQVLLRAHGAGTSAEIGQRLDAASAALGQAGVAPAQWQRDSLVARPEGKAAVEVVYPEAKPD